MNAGLSGLPALGPWTRETPRHCQHCYQTPSRVSPVEWGSPPSCPPPTLSPLSQKDPASPGSTSGAAPGPGPRAAESQHTASACWAPATRPHPARRPGSTRSRRHSPCPWCVHVGGAEGSKGTRAGGYSPPASLRHSSVRYAGKRFGSFLIRRPSLLGPRGRHSWGRDAQVHRKPHPLQLCSAGLQTGSERPSFQDRDSGNTAPAGTDPRSRTRGVAHRRLGLPLAPGWAALLRGGEGQAPSRGMEMSPSQRVQARQVHGSVLERIGHSTRLHSARSTVESHLGLRPLIAGAASAVQGCDRCQE